MDDETTPDRPEDGNDHVTTMKPLGTLQKHKAVRERQIWLNDKLLRECNTNNHSNTRCVYPASLFRWLAKHATCTVFAVLLGSLPNVIVHAI